MATLNTVILAGNLTRDPEARYTPKGLAICQVSLAVNRTWKNEAGEKQEEVSFIEAVAFGRTAEIISQYFHKGGNILITGRLKQDRWDDKATGQPRSKILVIIEQFQFLGKNGGNGEHAEPKAPEKLAPVADTSDLPKPEEDHVPF